MLSHGYSEQEMAGKLPASEGPLGRDGSEQLLDVVE